MDNPFLAFDLQLLFAIRGHGRSGISTKPFDWILT
jgi:hypothetical protein